MQSLRRGNSKILPEVFKERKKNGILRKLFFPFFNQNNNNFKSWLSKQVTAFQKNFTSHSLFSTCCLQALLPFSYTFFSLLQLLREGRKRQGKSRSSLPQKLRIQQLPLPLCQVEKFKAHKDQVQAPAAGAGEAPGAASEHLWVHGYFGMDWHPHPALMSPLGTRNGSPKPEITAQH